MPNVHENYWEKDRRTKVKENEWKEKISLKEELLRERKKIRIEKNIEIWNKIELDWNWFLTKMNKDDLISRMKERLALKMKICFREWKIIF